MSQTYNKKHQQLILEMLEKKDDFDQRINQKNIMVDKLKSESMKAIKDYKDLKYATKFALDVLDTLLEKG